MKSQSCPANMDSMRKDSFLWGKATLGSSQEEKKLTETVLKNKNDILDDIQKLRFDIENVMSEIHTMESNEENRFFSAQHAGEPRKELRNRKQ